MKLELESHSFSAPLWIIKTRMFCHFLKIDSNRNDLKTIYSAFKNISKEFKGMTLLSVEEKGNTVIKIIL